MIAASNWVQTLRRRILLSNARSAIGIAWDGAKLTPAPFHLESDVCAPTMRVLLDDGSSVNLVGTCNVLLRDGTQRSVEALAPGDSLMPFYTRINYRGRLEYRQLRDDRQLAPATIDRRIWRPLDRLVMEWRQSHQRLQPGVGVRHLDGDKRNCEPDNLTLTGGKQTKYRTRLLRFVQETRGVFRPDNNHSVAAVASFGEEPVVALHVEGADNLAVGGVIVVVRHGTQGSDT